MFDHVGISVSDRAASRRFYELGLSELGFDVSTSEHYDEWFDFAIGKASSERPHYAPGYYGAFVLDPDGNDVESVFHDRKEEP